jgi:hypothetical protein
MGLDRTIRFGSDAVPSWEAIRTHLRRVGEDGPLRMIDGLPAFPDEEPDAGWKELRVGLSGGMATLRRGADQISCVIWGNADPVLMSAWDKLCWATAVTGGGRIDTPSGPQTAEEFARSVGVNPA